jgi:hypothetical protein
MRVRLALLSMTTLGLLTGCVPLWQVELYNDSGEEITVVDSVGPKNSIRIPRGGSKALDVAMGQDDYRERFTIKTTATSWSYPAFHKLLHSLVRAPLWQEQSFPFGVFRAFARVDAQGHVYLLSPPKGGHGPQLLTPQPAGFPLKPQ